MAEVFNLDLYIFSVYVVYNLYILYLKYITSIYILPNFILQTMSEHCLPSDF